MKGFGISGILLLASMHAFGQQPFDLDPSFLLNVQDQYVSDVLPLGDNTILISGRFKFPGDEYFRSGSRIDLNGNLLEQWPLGNRITPWETMFYCGAGPGVTRVLSTGQTDFSYMNNASLYMGPQGGDFHVYEDGRLLISGSHLINIPEADLSGLYELVWVKTSGHLDTTRIHRKSNGVIYEIEEQPDGKFLCSGTGSTYEEQPVTVIFRIHPNGDLDTAFNAEVDYWGEAFEFLTLPDGRILAGGAFRTMDQQDTLCLIRMHPNGQLDQSFQPVRSKATFGAVSSGSYVLTIHRLPDGRLIIGGRFDHINDEVRGGIAMLTEDGGLVDEVFNGNGCGTYTPPASQFPVLGVASIREAPDGSFYIAGSYHGYDDGTTNDPLQRFVSRLYGLNVGVKELETVKLEVHPNPASDVVNIQIPADIRKAEFQFHDALGRLVHQEWITSVDRLSLDVGSWPAGLYQLQLIFEGSGRAVGKLIVE